MDELDLKSPVISPVNGHEVMTSKSPPPLASSPLSAPAPTSTTSLMKSLAQEAAEASPHKHAEVTTSTTSLQGAPPAPNQQQDPVLAGSVEFTSESTLQDSSPVIAADDIFNKAVPDTELLDTSANRGKAQLANVSALASRRPPTKKTAASVSHHSATIAPLFSNLGIGQIYIYCVICLSKR